MELDSSDKILLQRAYSSLGEANAIMRFLSEYFRDKYKLTPANQITPDGRIVNATPQRQIQEDNIGEYPNGEESREAAETSRSNSISQIP